MQGEDAVAVAYRRKSQPQSLDWRVSALAGRRYGVVSRAQLVRLGMSESAIQRRIHAGRLHPLHAGVYAVGHRVVPREGRWLAAILRAGEGAVLSHRSAAALWGIRRGSEGERIEITTPRSTRSCGTIRRHRARLSPDEITVRRSIPATTLPRTLLDIAAGLSVEGFEATIREAEYRHRLRLTDLDAILERYSGQRGTRTVEACRRHLGHGPRGRTRYRLEARFAALLARTNLPKPELNALLDLDGDWIEADCLWSSERVIVELDGGNAHRTRAAFESDRERDRRLQAAGWAVIRVTWRQLDEPDRVLDDLRKLLRRGEGAFAAG
jgi:uncharacterized protein DUF559/putative AbiEi antitoxin of type IV toxin-antitoxin system